MSSYWKIGHTPQEAERIISERNKPSGATAGVQSNTRAGFQEALKNQPRGGWRTPNKKSGKEGTDC